VLAVDEAGVGEEADAAQAQVAGVVAGLGQDAGAERERRHADGEAAVAALDEREIGMAATHRTPADRDRPGTARDRPIMPVAETYRNRWITHCYRSISATFRTAPRGAGGLTPGPFPC
jgi:hypothetical protein